MLIGKIAFTRFLSIAFLAVPSLLFGCSIPRLDPGPFQEGQDLFDTDSSLVAEKVLKPELPVVDFLRKRVWDAIDTFSFRLLFGPGIRGHARVTKFIQVGVGYVGPAEGKTRGKTFPVYTLGYIRRQGGLWQERTAEIGLSLFYYYEVEGKLLGGNKTYWSDKDRGLWDIGAAGHWLLIGAEAEVRPDEIFDFVTGFFGYDFMDDDGAPPDLDMLGDRLE